MRRRLPLFHYLINCLVWVVALPLTTFTRDDFSLNEFEWDATTRSWAVAIVGQGAFDVMTGLYTRRWRYGSFDEVVALAGTAVLSPASRCRSSTSRTSWTARLDRFPPHRNRRDRRSVAVRSAWRLYEQKRTKRELLGAAPLIIVGTGEGANQIIKALLGDATSRYQPVAMLDDDPARKRYSISGIRVCGPVSQMREVAARYGAENVLLAVPSAHSDP